METIHEYTDSRSQSLRIDRASGILHGVRILGYHSRNGRRYSETCLKESIPLYESAKVNVNHAAQSDHSGRDYRDRIGSLHRVIFRPGEGLYADFHYNPKHPLTEQLLWDAEHAPANVGFSHHVEAETTQESNEVVVRSIRRVISVDLVADPATTNGLFESCDQTNTQEKKDLPIDSCTVTNESTDTEFPYSSVADGTSETLFRSEGTENGNILRQFRESVRVRTQLQGRVTELEEEKRVRDRDLMIRRLLSEYHLPFPDGDDPYEKILVSEVFLRTLRDSEDEQTIRHRITDRVQLLREMRHRSYQNESSGSSVRRFVDAIRDSSTDFS
ncbi:MAG: hypothetical protein Q4C47_00705 [Planctomycetia bacterium]|nr:hypothetical protein [Planctomycetia bacterium]